MRKLINKAVLVFIICTTMVLTALMPVSAETWTITQIEDNSVKISRRPMTAGFYDSVANKTFVSWPGPSANPQVKAYDHSSGKWGETVQAGYNGTTDINAYHNYPAMIKANDGRILVFYGDLKGTKIHMSRSASSLSVEGTWSQTTLVSNLSTLAYPMPLKASNGDIYLYYRYRPSTPTNDWRIWEYIKSTDNGVTWSSPQVALKHDTLRSDAFDKPYIGSIKYEPAHGIYPERFMITWNLANTSNVNLRDMYFAYFHPSDQHFYSVNGTDLGTHIDQNEETQYCLVYDTGAVDPNNNNPVGFKNGAAYSDDGKPVITFESRAGNTGSVDMKTTRWTGSAWTTPTTFSASSLRDIEKIGPSSFRIYYVESTLNFDVLRSMKSTNGGATWSDDGSIQGSGNIGSATVIDNYHNDIKLIVTEIPKWSTANYNGDYKVWTAGTNNVEGGLPTYIADDTFDLGTTGNAPSGWSMEINPAGVGTITVAEVPSASDKSVRVHNSGTTSNNTYASKTFSPASGTITSEFKVRIDQTNKFGRLIYLYNNSGTAAVMTRINSSGYLQYSDGSTWVNAQSYTSGSWYTIKVVANTNTDTYDLYVNGLLIKSGASFTNAVDNIAKFQTGMHTDGGIMYFDNVKIVKTSSIVGDNFNSNVTGNAPSGWSMEINPAGVGTITVAEVPSASDKSVRVHNSGATSNNTYASKTFSPASGTITSEFKVRIDQTNKFGRLIYLYNNSGTAAVMTRINSSGYLQYSDGSTWVNAQSYTSGNWYTIKVVANTYTDTYNLYINGSLIISGAGFTNAVDNIAKFQTGMHTDGGIMYFDNVIVND